MDYRTLHLKTVVELRQLAKEMHVRLPGGTAKAHIIEMLLEAEKNPGPTDTPAEITVTPAADAAPRKRGRPRKNPTDSQSDAVQANPESAAETSTSKPASHSVEPASTAATENPALGADASLPTESESKTPAAGTAAAEYLSSKAVTVEVDGTPEASAANDSTKSASGVPVPANTGTGREDSAQSGAAANSPIRRGYASGSAAPRRQPLTAAHGQQTLHRTINRTPQNQGQYTPRFQRQSNADQGPSTSSPRFQRQGESYPTRFQRQNDGEQSQNGGYPARLQRQSDGEQSQNGSYPARFQRQNDGEQSQNGSYPTRFQRQSDGEQSQNGSYPTRFQRQNDGEQSQNGSYSTRFQRQIDGEQWQNSSPAASLQNQSEAPRAAEYSESGQQNEYNTTNQAVLDMLASGDCREGAGVLEIHPDGYGFLRAENYLPGANDTYVSIAQIHRFALRNGDYVEGKTRPQREGDRYSAMMYIDRVNGLTPDQNARRPRFENLVPVYPDKRLRLEMPDKDTDMALRLIDLLAPIGKGQRGMIVSPPKAGKTTLLKKIANAITINHPETHLIVLLIDERPEEVTDMKRSISGEVVYSTFDEAPENHARVSEMVLERAQRLVEHGKDVVVLLDSITRLARAYNLVIPPTGRSLSGGLDPGALHKPKRFFGAARNIENGGSLTIIATALVDTGSRMDDIIFEEFKGTGNMELHLDRKLSDRRIFPAIDMYRSGTRREELLLTPAELEGEYQARKMLGSSGNQEAVEQLITSLEKTSTNDEFFARMKNWAKAFEKDGFSLTGGKR